MLYFKVVFFVPCLAMVLGHVNCPDRCVCTRGRTHIVCDGRKERLTSIPENLPTEAVYLRLENNKISVLDNASFATLSQLKLLYLANNSLHFIHEGAFIGLRKLEKLDLSYNNLHYLTNKFTATFLGLDQLLELHLTNDSLTNIPDMVLVPLKRLEILKLDANLIQNATLGTGFRSLRNLKYFSLSVNKLVKLTNGSFHNIRQLKLEKLKVVGCNITHIEGGTFAGLVHLTKLSLSHNPLVISKKKKNAMLVPLCDTNITTLELNRINLKSIPKTISCFKYLRRLNISNNAIKMIGSGQFDFQNQLVLLDISGNELSTWKKSSLKGLKSLEILIMHDCELTKFPEFADRHGVSFIPNVTFINLMYNRITTKPPRRRKQKRSPLVGLEGASNVYLSHNNLKSLTMHFLSPLTKVKRLKLQKNLIKDIKPDALHQLKNLELLDISENPLNMTKHCFFKGMSSLKTLILANIDLHVFNSYYHDKDFNPACLFEGLVNLKMLDMRSIMLSYLPETFFKDLTGLEELILKNNRIPGWSENLFENITKLKSLDISVNNIRTINESSLKPIISTLTSFQAHNNPYVCDCKLAWYASWLRKKYAAKHFTLFIKPKISYVCSNFKNPSLSVLNYSPTFFECHRVTILTSSGAAGFVLITAVVIGLLYHYRWYFRYWMFLLRSRHSSYKEEQDPLLYTYDCFVTYSCNDSEWVIGQLLPKLEQEYGFRVCIHERDFELGKGISENIADSIEQSRKVLIVLTQNYVESGWCKFEVNLAHANTLHNKQKAKQSLIILLMEDVAMDGMTPILRYLIRNKTYIEWTEQEPGQTVFWTRLKDTISSRRRLISLSDD